MGKRQLLYLVLVIAFVLALQDSLAATDAECKSAFAGAGSAFSSNQVWSSEAKCESGSGEWRGCAIEYAGKASCYQLASPLGSGAPSGCFACNPPGCCQISTTPNFCEPTLEDSCTSQTGAKFFPLTENPSLFTDVETGRISCSQVASFSAQCSKSPTGTTVPPQACAYPDLETAEAGDFAYESYACSCPFELIEEWKAQAFEKVSSLYSYLNFAHTVSIIKVSDTQIRLQVFPVDVSRAIPSEIAAAYSNFEDSINQHLQDCGCEDGVCKYKGPPITGGGEPGGGLTPLFPVTPPEPTFGEEKKPIVYADIDLNLQACTSVECKGKFTKGGIVDWLQSSNPNSDINGCYVTGGFEVLWGQGIRPTNCPEGFELESSSCQSDGQTGFIIAAGAAALACTFIPGLWAACASPASIAVWKPILAGIYAIITGSPLSAGVLVAFSYLDVLHFPLISLISAVGILGELIAATTSHTACVAAEPFQTVYSPAGYWLNQEIWDGKSWTDGQSFLNKVCVEGTARAEPLTVGNAKDEQEDVFIGILGEASCNGDETLFCKPKASLPNGVSVEFFSSGWNSRPENLPNGLENAPAPPVGAAIAPITGAQIGAGASCSITPDPYSPINGDFTATINYNDPQGLKRCFYYVWTKPENSGNAAIITKRLSESEAACSGTSFTRQVPITVGENKDCRFDGLNTCDITCLAVGNSPATLQRDYIQKTVYSIKTPAVAQPQDCPALPDKPNICLRAPQDGDSISTDYFYLDFYVTPAQGKKLAGCKYIITNSGEIKTGNLPGGLPYDRFRDCENAAQTLHIRQDIWDCSDAGECRIDLSVTQAGDGLIAEKSIALNVPQPLFTPTSPEGQITSAGGTITLPGVTLTLPQFGQVPTRAGTLRIDVDEALRGRRAATYLFGINGATGIGLNFYPKGSVGADGTVSKLVAPNPNVKVVINKCEDLLLYGLRGLANPGCTGTFTIYNPTKSGIILEYDVIAITSDLNNPGIFFKESPKINPVPQINVYEGSIVKEFGYSFGGDLFISTLKERYDFFWLHDNLDPSILENTIPQEDVAKLLDKIGGEVLPVDGGKKPGDKKAGGGGAESQASVPPLSVCDLNKNNLPDILEGVGDSDGDGLLDCDEIGTGANEILGLSCTGSQACNLNPAVGCGCDPLNPDTDGDGLNDSFEVMSKGTCYDTDSDHDGISDGKEYLELYPGGHLLQQSFVLSDTDDDGLTDLYELGFDSNSGSVLGFACSDLGADCGTIKANADKYSASYPNINGVRHLDAKNADPDEDGLNDFLEISYQTNPFVSDTDDDGISDFDEVNFECSWEPPTGAKKTLNPTKADTDGDGILDGRESSLAAACVPGDPATNTFCEGTGPVGLGGSCRLSCLSGEVPASEHPNFVDNADIVSTYCSPQVCCVPITPAAAECGNGEPEQGEQCDSEVRSCTQGQLVGAQGCTDTCKWSTNCVIGNFCGDGVHQPEELCEFKDPISRERACEVGGHGGRENCNIFCNYGSCELFPYCGDGGVNQQSEVCDPPGSTLFDENGRLKLCTDLCEWQTVGCSALAECSSTFDPACGEGSFCDLDSCACQPITRGENCGDGVVQSAAPDFEECDWLDNQTQKQVCTAENGLAGERRCNLNCEYDEFCTPLPVCGDGIIKAPEQCEVGQVQACKTAEGYTGSRVCGTTCRWASCGTNEFCGDLVVNDKEGCDAIGSSECTPTGGGIGIRSCEGCNLTSCVGGTQVLCSNLGGICKATGSAISSGDISLGQYDCPSGQICVVARAQTCIGKGGSCKNSCGEGEIAEGKLECTGGKSCCIIKPKLEVEDVIFYESGRNLTFFVSTPNRFELKDLNTVRLTCKNRNVLLPLNSKTVIEGDGRFSLKIGDGALRSCISDTCEREEEVIVSLISNKFGPIINGGKYFVSCEDRSSKVVVPIEDKEQSTAGGSGFNLELVCTDKGCSFAYINMNEGGKDYNSLFLLKDSLGVVYDYDMVKLALANQGVGQVGFSNCPINCPCTISWKAFRDDDPNYIDPLPSLNSAGKELEFVC